jgi:hypothetical protein
MRRWRRPREEDLDDLDLDDDEDEKVRRYLPPRPLRITRFSDFEDEPEDDGGGIARFDKIKGLIRAGKYRPKPSDPWIAHILYNNLKALGEI